MFDIGWSEMAIIMLLALIIIGPKDLPRVARTIGQWVRKGRMLAREFQTSLEDMAKEAELDDVKKEIEKVGKTDLKKAVESSIDPKGDLKSAFDVSGKDEDRNASAKKALNGGGNGKAEVAEPEKAPEAASSAPAVTSSTTEAAATPKPAARSKPAAKATTASPSATAKSKAAAPKKPAASKPKAAASKSAGAPKKTATRKRASKPAASAKSASTSGGSDASSADETGGSSAMAAKSS